MGAIALIALLVVGVPYFYINVIEGEQPAPLSLSDVDQAAGTEATTEVTTDAAATPEAQPAAGSLAGEWTIGAGSQAGYRVRETLAGQRTVAVGRTEAVTGSLTLDDDAITAVEITVQVGEITSDNGRRDNQFTGRIMDAAQYPTAMFVLTEPIALAEIPADGGEATVTATGELTLRDTTNEVTFPLSVQRTDGGLAATGTIDIAYADYGIDNPSIGGFVSVGESGTVEFLVVAHRD